MELLLVFGLILTFGPMVGFMLCGTIMLYAALKEDGADKITLAVLLAIGMGLAMLATYAGLRFWV